MPWIRPVPGAVPLSRGRRRLFVVFTILLPLALLGLGEVILRLGGFGQTYPLFISSLDDAYRVVNPQVIRRFVADESAIPRLTIRPVVFRSVKSPDAFRIFVQGGSTAAGYPYGYGASPTGALQQRLQRTFPDRQIEVITTAVSAVNSYTLLDFSREILEQEPDLVVIYAGHNEYLGILGVGSTFSAGGRRPLVLSFLALKNVRILQLGRRLLGALRRQPETRDRRTLMERVVAEDRIPYGSSLYQRGLAQFRANLRALLARYRKAGVPTYLGTVVSNERDRPPFISGHRRGADLDAWRRHFDAGVRALRAGDPETALRELDAAVSVDDVNADSHFGRGRALEALERYGEARAAYLAAKDRDELRFRAPEAINDILREVAAEQSARVVDTEASFLRVSENGLVGRELMLEHLHPNLEGYFVLADAFYDALHADGVVGSWEESVPEAQARRELPVTEVDRLYGEYRIRELTAGWPFSKGTEPYEPTTTADPVDAIAQGLFRGDYPWPDAMRRLLDHYRAHGELDKASKVAALLADAFPYRRQDQITAAELLQKAGRTDFRLYLHRAREQEAATR